MAGEKIKLSPLLQQLRSIVASGGDASNTLKDVMGYAEFAWAAMYVITDTGNMLFKVAKFKRKAVMTGFGGSIKGNKCGIIFAMSKQRMELKDESSITLTAENTRRLSPLLLVRDGLVQIVMLKQAWVDAQKLWVPEDARKHWFWSKKSKDDITGFHEALAGSGGAELRASLENEGMRNGGMSTIESLSIDEAFALVGGGGVGRYEWRDCDGNTLRLIMPVINAMVGNKRLTDDIRFVDTMPWCTGEVQKRMNNSVMQPLWSLARRPWPPILKYHATPLKDYQSIRVVFESPGSMDTHGAAVQGALAKLWRPTEECDRNASERYIKRQRGQWDVEYPNTYHDALLKIQKWFAERELTKHLDFVGFRDMPGDIVEQPNRVSTGGQWLVFDYYHPGTPNIYTDAWLNDTGHVRFWHGSLFYGAGNIISGNHIMASAGKDLGHRQLWSQIGKEAGVYVSPHMYTSMYYAEPQVLFQDGVYWRLIYQLKARGTPIFHQARNGNQYVFPSDAIQITRVWVQPCAALNVGDRIHTSWSPLLECRTQRLSPRHHDELFVSSGVFVARVKPPFVAMRGSVAGGTLSGSSSARGDGQELELQVDSQRVWVFMAFFQALSNLANLVGKETPPSLWDWSTMSALEDFATTRMLCVNRVSLPPSEEDMAYGLTDDVWYSDVLSALRTSVTPFTRFRGRPQACDQLKSMLLSIVAKGINVYLGNVAANEVNFSASLTLHILCYVGSTAFSRNGLDGRWLSSKEKIEGTEEFHCRIKFMVRPPLKRERPKVSRVTKRYRGDEWAPAYLTRGYEALQPP